MIKRKNSQDQLAQTCMLLKINVKGKISNIKYKVGVLINLIEKLNVQKTNLRNIEDINNIIIRLAY